VRTNEGSSCLSFFRRGLSLERIELISGEGGKWTCGERSPGENSTLSEAERSGSRSSSLRGVGRLRENRVGESGTLRIGRGEKMRDLSDCEDMTGR
jgi:hypothetical protein